MSYNFHNLDIYSSGQQNTMQGNSMAYHYEGAPNAQSHDAVSFANLHILRHASMAALHASENVFFSQLYQENMRLKGQLEEKECNTIRRMSQTAVNNAPTKHLADPQPPASRSTDPVRRPSGSIQIPPSPPLCMSNDYPDAAFWTKKEWNTHTRILSANGTHFKKLDFLTDEEGRPIDEERLAVISKEAKLAWAELYYHRLDPRSWGLKTTTAAEYFSNYMRAKFVEFQLCESDWKIENYGTVKYSEWMPTRNSGGLLRQTPSDRVTTKVESRSTTTTRKVQTQKRPRIQPQAGPQDIIELDSDGEKTATITKRPRVLGPKPTNIATTGHITTTAAPSPPAILNLPPATTTTTALATPAATTTTPSATTTPPAPSSQTAPTTPSPAPSTPTTTTAPVAVAAATPSASSVACGLNVVQLPRPAAPSTTAGGAEPVPPLSSLLPSSSDNDANKSDSTGRTAQSSEFANDDQIPTTATPALDASAVSRTRGNRRNGAAILTNLTIPKPASHLLAPIGDARPSGATSTSETAKTRGGKGDKLVKDNGTTSARNLYMIDYLKEHGPTGTAAFKEIWDNIDADTAKKYKSLSAAAKKAT